MTTPADDIAVAQLRNRLDTVGEMLAVAVRDAYARGLVDGMERARALADGQRGADASADYVSDPAERRPTSV